MATKETSSADFESASGISLTSLLDATAVASPIILTCLVGLAIMIRLRKFLPWSAFVGMALFGILSIMSRAGDDLLPPQWFRSGSLQQIVRIYFLINLMKSMAFAVALGCLLHAILRMGMQRRDALAEQSSD
jgi:hypothetical protein